MLTLEGKFNTANIMIDNIDDATKNQIQGMLNHPAFSNTYIAIMPDCHAGKGSVVGFTMKMNDYVIPNIIGVDIGCGMLMNVIPDFEDLNLEHLDCFIKEYIPSGFRINEKPDVSIQLEKEIKEVCKMIGEEPNKALRSVGSLGGGNHFIEAGYNSKNQLCITIHSGSRNLGMKVASFYQNKAKECLEKYFIKNQYKDLEFLPVETSDASDYFYCLGVSQRLASENRKKMMKRITDWIGLDIIDEIESIHNFIADDGIIRKGATSAKIGERLIIPFNMADGIALCSGKGSPKYNFSAPHGAGRILSRSQAKKTLNIQDFENLMKDSGVFTTTATKDTIDEAPLAYKPKELILENIKETAEIIDFIKPVYNFKAGGE